MSKPRVRKGDLVQVLAGKNVGATGRVLRVFPDRNKVLVENVNRIKKHTRGNPQKGQQGGIVEREAPIHLSNVMVVDPTTGAPTRVRVERDAEGQRVRVAVKSGAVIDRT